MSKMRAKRSFLVAAAVSFWLLPPSPAPAQTVSFTRSDIVTGFNLPVSVAVGDFNGDRVPDLAVANNGDNTVSVLLGDGIGGFHAAPGSPFAVGTSPVWIVV